MPKILIRLGSVLLILVGAGIIVDAVAERTSERLVDKLVSMDDKTTSKEDPMEPDDII